eukprot:m51a1_g11736 hypothetical protein (233) ;mRNA; f:138542-139543
MVSSRVINRRVPFKWMLDNRVTDSDLIESMQFCRLHLEGQQNHNALEACERCCRGSADSFEIGKEVREVSAVGGPQRAFEFSNCISYCNSSRLHLGGRVVIVATIRRRGESEEVCRAASEPLCLRSRNYYTSRKQPVVPGVLKWVEDEYAPESSPETTFAESPDHHNLKPATEGELAGSGSSGAVMGELAHLWMMQQEQLQRIQLLGFLLGLVSTPGASGAGSNNNSSATTD